jgi:hypothetical protein
MRLFRWRRCEFERASSKLRDILQRRVFRHFSDTREKQIHRVFGIGKSAMKLPLWQFEVFHQFVEFMAFRFGEPRTGQLECVEDDVVWRRQVAFSQFGTNEFDVELGIVGQERCASDESDELRQYLFARGFISDHFVGYVMYFLRVRWYGHFGVYQPVCRTQHLAVLKPDRADFDNTPRASVEAGRFRVECHENHIR